MFAVAKESRIRRLSGSCGCTAAVDAALEFGIVQLNVSSSSFETGEFKRSYVLTNQARLLQLQSQGLPVIQREGEEEGEGERG